MKERIKQVRKQLRQTQAAFAAHVGVTRDVVASWENGRVEPPEAVIRLICRDQGVSYEWLKEGKEPMSAPAETVLVDKLERIMSGDNEFVKVALRELINMPTEAWEHIGTFVDRLYQARSHGR
ncbi:MAG: helix-turn-helix transcriptional regulator [Candidatus Limiplasma sp.]|nr:helix-turn-helix transcriptional regulator [Candidatus Limiplasma sp.]MEA5146546.1 helix-turn-helix transcriptional regulator [Candidatus Limiplasma sp.]